MVIVMVRYWLFSDGDVNCCYGGSCYFLNRFFYDGSICGLGSGGGVTIGFGGSFLVHHHHKQHHHNQHNNHYHHHNIDHYLHHYLHHTPYT